MVVASISTRWRFCAEPITGPVAVSFTVPESAKYHFDGPLPVTMSAMMFTHRPHVLYEASAPEIV